MALTSCPTCAHQVSEQAATCPNCGQPLNALAPGNVAATVNMQGTRTSLPAIFSLVFGLLSWCLLPVIGAIIAVIVGYIARNEIRRAPQGTIDGDGDGMAIAGLILGWAHLLLLAFGLALFVFLISVHQLHF